VVFDGAAVGARLCHLVAGNRPEGPLDEAAAQRQALATVLRGHAGNPHLLDGNPRSNHSEQQLLC
jgi:hypothetical protein